MSFLEKLQEWPRERVQKVLKTASPDRIARILHKERLLPEDFLLLLTPQAKEFLEPMARRVHESSTRYFGRTMQLFTPLYLSDYCSNHCLYCGFNCRNKKERRTLDQAAIVAEGQAIAATGLRSILLLTGDAPHKAGVEYIAGAARILRPLFPSIGVEVFAMTRDEYATLVNAGVDSLTMFQETYNPELYARVHPAGPKRNYQFRLDAPQRGAEAGMRFLGLGALLGLDDWHYDAFYTGLHAAWLQTHFPAVDISVSVPRMRPHLGSFVVEWDVTDADLIQIILALRLFLPLQGVCVSSREDAHMRNHMVGLGVTRMSAGVSTAVGGHAKSEQDVKHEGQFDIADTRSVDEMVAACAQRGYQVVFKDWEPLQLPEYRIQPVAHVL